MEKLLFSKVNDPAREQLRDQHLLKMARNSETLSQRRRVRREKLKKIFRLKTKT
jgi:hypothetical protein